MHRKNVIIALLLQFAILFSVAGCAPAPADEPLSGTATADQPDEPAYASTETDDSDGDASQGGVGGKPVDTVFIANIADFSMELFKTSRTGENNSLISPLSIMLALTMTANGADNETFSQIERLLGGGIPLTDLNEYLYSYITELTRGNNVKFNIANSIWFCDNEDGLQIDPWFVQKSTDYFNASVFSSDFDSKTLDEINNWVNSNTEGMIDRIIDDIDPDAMVYLINVIAFDADWKLAYTGNDVHEGIFTNINRNQQNVEFMHSMESKYLDDGNASGFIKPYINGRYSFAALLPNEDISIEEYIATLTGAGLLEILNNAENTDVYTALPKFSYEYGVQMNEVLIALGISDAFDAALADFSQMAKSDRGNIYISRVLHKTFISVDELGTRAGAATEVEVAEGISEKTVLLNRPFIYAIVDNKFGLPLFVGTLMTV